MSWQLPPLPMAQPSQPPLNDRIADVVLKVVMAGGLPAGGVGAIWILIQDSDIPRAIASAVIGLGISYGATLLEKVHEGNKRRLGKAGEAIDSGIDQITDNLIATATRFEDKYRLCQASACERLRPEGVVQQERILVARLEEVFVSLVLDFSARLPGFRGLAVAKEAEDLPREDLEIWELLQESRSRANFRQLAILAWGGYGKTTLLRHVAYCYGRGMQPPSAPKLIPVLLVLRKYREVLDHETPPDLPTLINESHIPSLPRGKDLHPPENWAKSMLKQGKMIVMLDGFDEVARPQRPAVAAWINQQLQEYGKSVFILTSRPKAYKDADVATCPQLATLLWVREFDKKQREKFVTKWYLSQEREASPSGRDTLEVEHAAAEATTDLLNQIEARQELKDLAKNPLLLNMITTFHRRNPGARIPQRRVDLYREICQLQLRDRPRARNLDTVLLECDAQAVLQQVACGMMKKRWERIQQPVLIKGLRKFLAQQEESIDATEFLDQVVQISELLVQQEDEYEFAHLSFQEYLASAYIAQDRRRESLLHEHLEDDWWKPTILLYVSQANPTRLIQEMLRRGLSDLAYNCWQETTKRVDPALESELASLKQQVKTSRYAQLEEYLKNKQWKEADRETERLMLTAVGKEEGQFLDPDDLRDFPCEELLAIDGLWVRYSEGRFGFSVQKDIYTSEDVGGVADGRYDNDAWERFRNEVGWENYDVKYDTSSPRGHLPSVGPRPGWPLVLLSHHAL